MNTFTDAIHFYTMNICLAQKPRVFLLSPGFIESSRLLGTLRAMCFLGHLARFTGKNKGEIGHVSCYQDDRMIGDDDHIIVYGDIMMII